MATTITKNFTLEELTKTSHKVTNKPSDQAIINLTLLCAYILQPLRNCYGKPINISSGYRSAELNKLVGGVSSSQHLYGQAADLQTGTKAGNKKLFELCKSLDLPFDQLINEYNYSWIHVSYSDRNRRQSLAIS